MFNRKSSYALNKKDPNAIVYMDANEAIIRLTREDFASEEEFLKWKSLSDADYHASEKEDHVYANHMTTGISIMDLGLNEFRLDLLDYIKHHPDIDKTPFGLHSVVPASEDAPAGVIYVLKNRSNSVNIDNQNRLHPFYMVYIGNDGEVICDHLSPKQMLDKMRFLCKGKTEPIPEAYKPFNKETRDGKDIISSTTKRPPLTGCLM